jgi:chemotaxis protein methyltransferase CheR
MHLMDDKRVGDRTVKPMTAEEFGRFSEFISSHCGIKMPPAKKVMLEARLQKRLRCLRMGSYREYFDYLSRDAGGGELVRMIDAVTTNKTDFFREPAHFDYLVRHVLPQHVDTPPGVRPPRFVLWSAGCSTGEEPYTLAMVLAEFASRNPSFSFSLLATDISTRVLDHAREGIYDRERVAPVPPAFKQKYLLRSKDPGKGLVRIVPLLRAAVQFHRLNLMDEQYSFAEPFDMIFCRNVIIYFDRRTQERLVARFCRCLKSGGYLFLGHSETVYGFDVPLERVVSTVYRKAD